ncbi:hypothetical protein LCGC14_2713460 [marine sediment metagenome]|uniref:Cyclic nucleotide-binding domain-containing protein n=1 Tax=marine sediment metagenome TaxID=412755 RepID=A0A0F8ZZY3_9ZZZZ
MKKRYTALTAAASLLVGGLLVVGWLAFENFGDNKFNKGYNAGVVQGRRQVVDAILINVANEGNVVIRQGEQTLTLVVARSG